MSELPNNCKRLREQLKKSLEREEAIEKELEMSLAQVKDREHEIEEIEVKCCACHAGHIAQVAVLRGALETVVEMGTYRNDGYASEDMLEEPWATVAANALADTPAEAAGCVQKLVEALEGIQGFLAQGEANAIIALEIADKALADWRRV